MRFGKEKHKTKALKRVLHPVWEERFVFGSSERKKKKPGIPGPLAKPEETKSLIVKIKDKDRFSTNDRPAPRLSFVTLTKAAPPNGSTFDARFTTS